MRLVTIAAVTITFVMSGSVAFAQSRGAHAGMGSRSLSGSRLGSSRPIAIPPPVTHLAHSRGAIVPYPVYYGGDYYTRRGARTIPGGHCQSGISPG
jgi:hypothetical protein